VKELINDPFEVVDEMFTGFVAANDRIVKAMD
jgi:dihydroxyacetone kinase